MTDFVVDPKLKEWATARQAQFIDATNEHGSAAKAAKVLGVSASNLSDAFRILKAKAAVAGYSPEHDMTRTVPAGFGVKGTSTLYNAKGEISAQWVKTKRDDTLAEQVIRDFIGHLVEDARGLSPVIPSPAHADNDLLCVYPMGDPHFGLYAWAEESGESFDLAEAERLTCAAFDRLVESAPPAETALILELGDFFHSNTSENRTRSGHALDVDGRYTKVMQVGLRAMVYAIKRALEKHKRVVVRIVKGNHDNESSFALALALDAFFSNNDRVLIDMTASVIWAFQFGKVMIASTHGDECKMSALPGVMACDWPEMWGGTKFRYGYLGHVHHDEVKEYPGAKCETFRTLAARDAWHAGQGYRAGRDMRLIVHHREFGEIERHRCDVSMLAA